MDRAVIPRVGWVYAARGRQERARVIRWYGRVVRERLHCRPAWDYCRWPAGMSGVSIDGRITPVRRSGRRGYSDLRARLLDDPGGAVGPGSARGARRVRLAG